MAGEGNGVAAREGRQSPRATRGKRMIEAEAAGFHPFASLSAADVTVKGPKDVPLERAQSPFRSGN